MAQGTKHTALFDERRRGSAVFWGLSLGLPIIFGFGTLRDLAGGVGNWFNFWMASLFAVSFYAFFLFLFLGPWGGEFKHLRVDERGVWIRSKLLPAAEIGQARVLSETEAARVTAASRIEGIWLLSGRATFSYFSSHGSAVYIRRHRPDGKVVPWLLATHHPQELLAAIDQVRDVPGSTFEPPARGPSFFVDDQ